MKSFFKSILCFFICSFLLSACDGFDFTNNNTDTDQDNPDSGNQTPDPDEPSLDLTKDLITCIAIYSMTDADADGIPDTKGNISNLQIIEYGEDRQIISTLWCYAPDDPDSSLWDMYLQTLVRKEDKSATLCRSAEYMQDSQTPLYDSWELETGFDENGNILREPWWLDNDGTYMEYSYSADNRLNTMTFKSYTDPQYEDEVHSVVWNDGNIVDLGGTLVTYTQYPMNHKGFDLSTYFIMEHWIIPGASCRGVFSKNLPHTVDETEYMYGFDEQGRVNEVTIPRNEEIVEFYYGNQLPDNLPFIPEFPL